ncbi:hypothetical protein ORQ98_19590 [Spartinivicinus sp. A2-2]|uniref:Uncharacterized protein n=1 Tax=Spartinivicinus poritis TaxID=2994640 RepID=A0ABT5UCR0_9GAMM|nr:hypothetical protein [Spartinivicinus sp. A2-2]
MNLLLLILVVKLQNHLLQSHACNVVSPLNSNGSVLRVKALSSLTVDALITRSIA